MQNSNRKDFFTIIKSVWFFVLLFVVGCTGNPSNEQATSTAAAATATEIRLVQLTSTSIAMVIENAVAETLAAATPTITNTPEPPTDTPVPTNTLPPTNTPLPTATPRPTFTPTPDPCFEPLSAEDFEDIDVRELQQYPDDHIGKVVKISGTVKLLRSEGIVRIVMFVHKPDTLIGVVPVVLYVLRECVNPNIYEGTRITAYGFASGQFETIIVETPLLGSREERAPVVMAVKVVKN